MSALQEHMRRNLNRFYSRRLGTDIEAVPRGEVVVVPSARRKRREVNYSKPFPVFVLLWRGRCIVSVRPELKEAAEEQTSGRRSSYSLVSPRAGRSWVSLCEKHLPHRLAPSGWRFFRIPVYSCFVHPPPTRIPGATVADGRTLANVPWAKGMHVHGSHLERDDEISCCVVHRGRAVSEAWTISDGDKSIGGIGTLTAPAYRRRGFGRLALQTLTERLIKAARAPRYTTGDYNLASNALARSAGYHRVALALRVQAL